MKRLGNQIVMKLMFKLKVDTISEPKIKYRASYLSPPQFPRGNSHPTIIIRQSVIAITTEEQGSIKINPIGSASEQASGRNS